MKYMKTLSAFVCEKLWIVLFYLMMVFFNVFSSQAHEIPSGAKVQVFLNQDEQLLTLLIRAPMSAIKEVEFPLINGTYLNLAKVKPSLEEAAQLWFTDNLKIFQNSKPLFGPSIKNVRISLPSERSFIAYETALAHVQKKEWDLPENLVWSQQYLDIELAYPLTRSDNNFAIDFGLQRLALQVSINLRFKLLNAQERVYELNAKEGFVLLNPSIWQASWRFMKAGFEHILSGLDHLLFIACLILLAPTLLELFGVITSFTLAHSITLIASAIGYAPSGLWFVPWVEWAIAFSIVYMAVENIWNPSIRRRWIVCALFGLIHGFGFSFVLHETLQFAGSHWVTSLLSFNLGVEAGQVLILLIGFPLCRQILKNPKGQLIRIIFSVLIAHIAWHWMSQRWEVAAKFLPAYLQF